MARWMGDCRPQQAVRFKGWFPDQQLRSTWELVRNANLGLVNPPNMGVGWELSLGNCRGLSDAGWSLKEAWLLSICIRIEESKPCEWPPLGALGSEFSQGSQVVFCARSENRFLEQPRPSPQLPRKGEGHFSQLELGLQWALVRRGWAWELGVRCVRCVALSCGGPGPRRGFTPPATSVCPTVGVSGTEMRPSALHLRTPPRLLMHVQRLKRKQAESVVCVIRGYQMSVGGAHTHARTHAQSRLVVARGWGRGNGENLLMGPGLFRG